MQDREADLWNDNQRSRPFLDSKADSLDVKEPKEEKKDQQEEVVDS